MTTATQTAATPTLPLSVRLIALITGVLATAALAAPLFTLASHVMA